MTRTLGSRLELVESGASFQVWRIDYVVVAVWRRPASSEALSSAIDVVGKLARRCGRLELVSVVHPRALAMSMGELSGGVSIVGADLRAVMSEIDALVSVVYGHGMKARLTRVGTATLTSLFGVGIQSKVFAELEPGLAWLSERSTAAFDPAALAREIESLPGPGD